MNQSEGRLESELERLAVSTVLNVREKLDPAPQVRDGFPRGRPLPGGAPGREPVLGRLVMHTSAGVMASDDLGFPLRELRESLDEQIAAAAVKLTLLALEQRIVG